MEKERIKQAYLDYVLRKSAPPASVFKFTQKLGIPQAEVYRYYAKFAAIDRRI